MTSDVALVDTNLFIRIFTKDDPPQVQAALNVFKEAKAGRLTLVVHDLIIAEIVWVLESSYGFDARSVRRHILALLNTPGVKIEPADLGARTDALELYAEKNIDFIDAYSITWMKAKGIKSVYTFNKTHFSRAEGIDVRVPQ